MDGLFGLACCPLCGREGVPLDLRHVLSGECSEGVTAEERARAVALLGGLGAALPLRADEGKDAGEHDAAMGRESQLAARVFGTARAAGLREMASALRHGEQPDTTCRSSSATPVRFVTHRARWCSLQRCTTCRSRTQLLCALPIR